MPGWYPHSMPVGINLLSRGVAPRCGRTSSHESLPERFLHDDYPRLGLGWLWNGWGAVWIYLWTALLASCGVKHFKWLEKYFINASHTAFTVNQTKYKSCLSQNRNSQFCCFGTKPQLTASLPSFSKQFSMKWIHVCFAILVWTSTTFYLGE